jgi:YHYH protein/Fibronectin type III domain
MVRHISGYTMDRTFLALACALVLPSCGPDTSAGPISQPPVPATTPGAPTIGAATPGNGSASIVFTPPMTTGSSAITGYTASCAAGSNTANGTGAASPLNVAGLTNGTSYACSVTARNAAGTGPASAPVSVTPAAATVGGVDPTKLPVGDNYIRTSGPGVGYAFVCAPAGMGGGASSKGPWFNADGTTWNSTTKLIVSGVVTWVSNFLATLSGNTLSITGNGLPNHSTGTFPVPVTDPVRTYDRNPNTIAAQTIAWGLPGNPTINATPSCMNNGAIGVLVTGARLFAPNDELNRDAVAWEAQDSCQGHPQIQGVYHYHNISSCLSQNAATKDVAGQHSPLVGYAADGFGIYGNLGEAGLALTNADLDICHGHTHAVTINGSNVVQYHYHKTAEFPYAVGCYRGTPVTVN